MTNNEIQDLDSRLNELNRNGKILDGLEEFYAETCVFQEGNEAPIVGKEAQRDRLSAMFATLKGFNGATLHGQAVQGATTFTEWTFDMTGSDDERIVWNEVLVRHWENGKVVRERFYKA